MGGGGSISNFLKIKKMKLKKNEKFEIDPPPPTTLEIRKKTKAFHMYRNIRPKSKENTRTNNTCFLNNIKKNKLKKRI